MITCGISFNEDIFTALTQHSKEQNRSRSNMVNVILSEYFNKKINIKIDPKPKVKPAPKIKKSQPHWIIDVWNQHCGRLPKARTTATPKRLSSLKARESEYSKEEIIEAVQKLSKSHFVNGLNDRSWTASFDWFIKSDSIDKTLEGKYDNRPHLSENDLKGIKLRQQVHEDIERGLYD